MNEQWNFHNYVAVPLENYSRKYIGWDHTTANCIDTGEFVDTMLSVLLLVYGSFDDLGSFVDACREYDGVPHSKIPDSVAQELFADFERLVRIKVSNNK